MTITLDRIALADVGANPERLAAAIHTQLGDLPGRVPVHEIARALDIVEIREEPLSNLEAALLTGPERSTGAILINSRSSPQRRRFSLGHELGHYVNEYHRPTSPNGFACSKPDMIEAADRTRHLRQESEANRFSIELLAPRHRMKPYLRADVSLETVDAIARAFDISRQAATRRYVELHDEHLIALFCRRGKIAQVAKGAGTPHLAFWTRDEVPEAVVPDAGLRPVDPSLWLSGAVNADVFAEAREQADGWVTVLVHIEPHEFEDMDL